MSDVLQREAASLRDRWLGRALSTRPADRKAAAAAVSALYRFIGLSPPRFHWVTSPAAAFATVPAGLPPGQSAERVDAWPLPARFATLRHRVYGAVHARVRPAQRPVDVLLRREVHQPLLNTAGRCLLPPVELAHNEASRHQTWYRTMCVSWIAHCDALRRIAGVELPAGLARQVDLWTAVATTCHWWWPSEHVCVMSERPAELHTETWTATGEQRPHHADGPSARYADGWATYAWHGTRIPSWVIHDPTPERISAEPNVEVRRCAIERLGWPAYIARAELRLVATAPDPGNAGAELRLYDMRRDTRVLLAVNGSVERDGRRRQYGLTVPGHFDDPLAAAGWTYGLSGEQYAQLLRRT
ncbi:DUF6745 domain-containing protein [Nonomuraea sp. NPDC004580]|uniref:DUF6745 domain-containing protein n=1 Tax=Nonomuraea sp. NPDC004580 TaxID=3154552 RepID=UPI0033B1FCE4